MKKIFLFVILLAVSISFAATGLKVGGGVVLESTKITDKRVVPGAAVSLEVSFSDQMGAILNFEYCKDTAGAQNIALATFDYYINVFQDPDLPTVRLLLTTHGYQAEPIEKPVVEETPLHFSVGVGFEILTPIYKDLYLSGYMRAMRLGDYATSVYNGQAFLPEYFSGGFGLLWAF